MRLRDRWQVIPLLAFIIGAALQAQTPAAIKSPEEFFGFRMGADRELADWPALQRYVEGVAAQSDRVEIVDAGPSMEGRRMIAAIVSAPANIARLDEIRANAMRLSDPRGLDNRAAAVIVEHQPVIVAVGMSVHASEIGATQAAPELLHRLATSPDSEVLRVLQDVVLILFPSLNPDGHVMTVDWYRKGKGTEYEGTDLPGLYHRYAGHDLNRDAFMLNMAENRAMADFFYRRWRPQVFLAMHQMGQYGARFFVPPNTDPIAPNYDPLIWRTAGLLGNAMALRLEQDGRAGVLQNALYDYFSPGYEDAAQLGHNTVSLLTEAASARVATPIPVARDQLLGGGRGFPNHAPSMAFPHPWPGGTWQLRDVVDYDLSAVYGLLDAAARYRGELVRNFYDLGARQIELGRKGGPFAYIIPPDQFDLHSAQRLTQVLIDGAVDVESAREPFRVAETLYPAGTGIVLMAQPYRAYAKTLLEVQNYPARQTADHTPERPYDVTGWTLPLQMNVKVDRIDQYFDPPPSIRLDRATIPPAHVDGEQPAQKARMPNGSYFLVDGSGNGASIAANRLLKLGARVAWSSAPVLLQGVSYPTGALVVADVAGVRPVIAGISQQLGLRVAAIVGPLPRDLRQIGRARVGLYKSWVANPDEGWTRWLLEQYEFPFATLTDADIRRGSLRKKFDAIILPDQNAGLLFTGHAAGTMPEEFTGGLGTEGTAMLKQFVDAGGTLVALDSAGELVVNLLGAPVRDTTYGVPPEEFFCPGSIVRIELESDPLTYGMPRETAGVFSFSGAYDLVASTSAAPEAPATPTARIVARYAKNNVLMSGWLEGERVIAGKGAVVEVRSGQGRAILIAFRAQHRGQSHATFRLLFNAIHTSGQ